jgi:hypothetical protein
MMSDVEESICRTINCEGERKRAYSARTYVW